MTQTATVLSFPAAAIVREAPKPKPPQKQYSLSPEAKWMFFRTVREDASLSMDSVLAMGHILDFYSQPAGFSAPSIGSIARHCRFFENKHRKHDIDRTAAAINALIRNGYLKAEPFETEPGSGYPGYKFFPVHQKDG